MIRNKKHFSVLFAAIFLGYIVPAHVSAMPPKHGRGAQARSTRATAQHVNGRSAKPAPKKGRAQPAQPPAAVPAPEPVALPAEFFPAALSPEILQILSTDCSRSDETNDLPSLHDLSTSSEDEEGENPTIDAAPHSPRPAEERDAPSPLTTPPVVPGQASLESAQRWKDKPATHQDEFPSIVFPASPTGLPHTTTSTVALGHSNIEAAVRAPESDHLSGFSPDAGEGTTSPLNDAGPTEGGNLASPRGADAPSDLATTPVAPRLSCGTLILSESWECLSDHDDASSQASDSRDASEVR